MIGDSKSTRFSIFELDLNFPGQTSDKLGRGEVYLKEQVISQELYSTAPLIEGLTLYKNTDVHISTGKLSYIFGDPSEKIENLSLLHRYSLMTGRPFLSIYDVWVDPTRFRVPGSCFLTSSGENLWPSDKGRTRDSLARLYSSTEDSIYCSKHPN